VTINGVRPVSNTAPVNNASANSKKQETVLAQQAGVIGTEDKIRISSGKPSSKAHVIPDYAKPTDKDLKMEIARWEQKNPTEATLQLNGAQSVAQRMQTLKLFNNVRNNMTPADQAEQLTGVNKIYLNQVAALPNAPSGSNYEETRAEDRLAVNFLTPEAQARVTTVRSAVKSLPEDAQQIFTDFSIRNAEFNDDLQYAHTVLLREALEAQDPAMIEAALVSSAAYGGAGEVFAERAQVLAQVSDKNLAEALFAHLEDNQGSKNDLKAIVGSLKRLDNTPENQAQLKAVVAYLQTYGDDPNAQKALQELGKLSGSSIGEGLGDIQKPLRNLIKDDRNSVKDVVSAYQKAASEEYIAIVEETIAAKVEKHLSQALEDDVKTNYDLQEAFEIIRAMPASEARSALMERFTAVYQEKKETLGAMSEGKAQSLASFDFGEFEIAENNAPVAEEAEQEQT
jgi:hypothetical protein